MRRLASFVAVLAAASAACGPANSGQGGGSGAKPGSDGVTTTDGDSTTGDSSGTTATAIDGSDSSGGTTVGPTDGDSGTTTTPDDPCDPPPLVVHEIDLSTALLDTDMSEGTLASIGTYAFSETAELGSVSFGFDVECEDRFQVWALVHDPQTGFTDLGTFMDPDSYRVGFDADTTTPWLYGCQMTGATLDGGPAWAWLSVRDNPFCVTSEFRRLLEPGPHRFRVVNLEEGTYAPAGEQIGSVAAISRVIVTNDPSFSP